MVTVTGKADDVFVVELVQLLSAEEAANARTSLLKLLRLAVEINSSNLKRSAPWAIDDSPVKAKNAGSWDAARLENQWVSHFCEQQFQSGDDILLEAHNADARSTEPA